MRQVNEELQIVAPAFLESKVVEVGHLGDPLPRGTRPYQPAPPVITLDTGGRGAVVSRLQSSTYEYLALVCRELHSPMNLMAGFDSSMRVETLEESGSWRPLLSQDAPDRAPETTCRSTVTPGDIRLFRWAR